MADPHDVPAVRLERPGRAGVVRELEHGHHVVLAEHEPCGAHSPAQTFDDRPDLNEPSLTLLDLTLPRLRCVGRLRKAVRPDDASTISSARTKELGPWAPRRAASVQRRSRVWRPESRIGTQTNDGGIRPIKPTET